jgi:hypothetical protein
MPYRDDRKALEDRHADLVARLAHIDGLEREAPALRRELADVAKRLAESTRPALPVLEDLRIASPCSESWDGMSGDERVRFCGRCNKNVYNLSAMTRAEAESLVAAREGRVCVRFYKRFDGTVLTTDCPEGQRKRRRRLAVVAAGAGAIAAAATAFAITNHSRGPARGVHVTSVVETTGMLAVPPSPPSAPPPSTSDNTTQTQPLMGTPAVFESATPVQPHHQRHHR